MPKTPKPVPIVAQTQTLERAIPETKTATSETERPLTRRTLRAKRLAAELVTGERTYAEIGAELYPNATAPKQTIYSALQNPGVQREIARLTRDIYDEHELRQTVTDLLRKGRDPIRLKAAELGMREKAMLIDRSQVQSLVVSRTDLTGLDTDQLAAELVLRLKVSAQGAKLGPGQDEG